uniref:Uncharacterized protein n=1 Tax=Lepeophtheirus salmonis TaxID=72036 RepID=A0A0K2VGU0_LEPSM
MAGAGGYTPVVLLVDLPILTDILFIREKPQHPGLLWVFEELFLLTSSACCHMPSASRSGPPASCSSCTLNPRIHRPLMFSHGSPDPSPWHS